MSETRFSELMNTLRTGLRDLSPNFSTDVSENGGDVLLVTVRNPHDPYWGVTYEAGADRSGRVTGSLWFGQCRVTGFLDASDAAAAIRSVTNGQIVAVVRYRNEEDREDRHPSDLQKVFQLLPDGQDDDSAAYASLMKKLHSEPGFFSRFDPDSLGVFEIAQWGEVTVLRRGKAAKKDKQPKKDNGTENNSANKTNESI